MTGNLSVHGGIRIDGKLAGTLKSESTIYIGPEAEIDAEISAKSLISSGKIRGVIQAEDTVTIRHPGSLEGEVKTCNLHIDKSVFFNARCQLLSPQNNHKPKLKRPKTPRIAIPNRD